jgi:mannose-1-phosphate guanylyltransferase/phosphomannomutase
VKAVIMAGGEGTRLRPLTSNQPKPMLPLANRPMMEHVVMLLKEHGFTDIVVTVAFMANTIRTYFGDGSEFGVRMVYATEETPLGTAGSVRNAMDVLKDEPFLVISGDVLTDIDLSAVVRFHEDRGALVTIGLKAMENPLEFGIVITRPDGAVERFLEKPGWGQVFSDTINTGIYVMQPEVFDWIDADASVDWSSDVFPKMLAADKPIYGAVCEGYWEDVGTIEAYRSAHLDVLDSKVELSLDGFRLSEGVILGEGTEIHPDAVIQGPAVLGDYTRVDAGARLKPYTVLGNNVRVGPDAEVERSVVHDNVYLGRGVRLRGCVVGRSSDLRQGARIEEGVTLGDQCFVGEHAIVNPGVKVFPFKTVEANAIVNSSIVWETRGVRSLFGRDGITGLANVDISPELAVKVAMAYGTTLKKGDRVTASRDTSRAARVLKRAMIVGLNSVGIDVDDLEAATVPVTRFQLRGQRTRGGFTVRLDPSDTQAVTIRFFAADGTDISEEARRKIERLFHREELRRAVASDLGEINFPPRALEYYTAGLAAGADVSAIKAATPKVVLDYAYGTASFVMPHVLAKLGADVLALNPYGSTKLALAFDVTEHAKQVAELVRGSGASLGAVIDPAGERLTIVDDTGHQLTCDEALLAFVSLIAETHEDAKFVFPVSITSHAERLARDHGASVVWSKLSNEALMAAASEPGISFAADAEGGYIVPSFLPAFDAAAAFALLVGLLASSGRRLSKVVGALPRVHVVREEVVTPWESKGMVMRHLVERTTDRPQVLVDGVKVIHDDGWVLVLPDPEEPVTHVWAEAPNNEEARALAQEYARRIRTLLR